MGNTLNPRSKGLRVIPILNNVNKMKKAVFVSLTKLICTTQKLLPFKIYHNFPFFQKDKERIKKEQK